MSTLARASAGVNLAVGFLHTSEPGLPPCFEAGTQRDEENCINGYHKCVKKYVQSLQRRRNTDPDGHARGRRGGDSFPARPRVSPNVSLSLSGSRALSRCVPVSVTSPPLPPTVKATPGVSSGAHTPHSLSGRDTLSGQFSLKHMTRLRPWPSEHASARCHVSCRLKAAHRAAAGPVLATLPPRSTQHDHGSP